ncbi:hypothetical protein RchiOBHm_Chr5g0051571 [Rosa chinensis]|uniref:Uncharacterized protein n=1 Tax=Rosa chinensis TaxID=74649 RepID=A0A2P6QFE2_ROSCH|nr:hypothetical protein RchiOBHm_Chr5g0051571 [Rosa chinensis]
MIWSAFLTQEASYFIVYKPLTFLFKTGLSSPYSSPIPLAWLPPQSSEPSLSLSNSLLISIMQQKSNKIRPKICQEYLQKI